MPGARWATFYAEPVLPMAQNANQRPIHLYKSGNTDLRLLSLMALYHSKLSHYGLQSLSTNHLTRMPIEIRIKHVRELGAYWFSGSLHVSINLRELPVDELLQQAKRPSLRNYLATTFGCPDHAPGQHYHPRHVRHVPYHPLSTLHYRNLRRAKLDTGGSGQVFAIYQRHCRYGSISTQAPWVNVCTSILATVRSCTFRMNMASV